MYWLCDARYVEFWKNVGIKYELTDYVAHFTITRPQLAH